MIGFIILGRDFGVKTAYVTVVSSLLLNVFEEGFSYEQGADGEYYAGALLCDHFAGAGCGAAVF